MKYVQLQFQKDWEDPKNYMLLDYNLMDIPGTINDEFMYETTLPQALNDEFAGVIPLLGSIEDFGEFEGFAHSIISPIGESPINPALFPYSIDGIVDGDYTNAVIVSDPVKLANMVTAFKDWLVIRNQVNSSFYRLQHSVDSHISQIISELKPQQLVWYNAWLTETSTIAQEPYLRENIVIGTDYNNHDYVLTDANSIAFQELVYTEIAVRIELASFLVSLHNSHADTVNDLLWKHDIISTRNIKGVSYNNKLMNPIVEMIYNKWFNSTPDKRLSTSRAYKGSK
jgi:hypothetical protein